MHEKGLANEDHTTLLLNCFTKLKDEKNLNNFIMVGCVTKFPFYNHCFLNRSQKRLYILMLKQQFVFVGKLVTTGMPFNWLKNITNTNGR